VLTVEILPVPVIIIVIIIIIIMNTLSHLGHFFKFLIGATETVSKSYREYVSTIPGNHDVRELQNTAILGTAHILRKVLM
jgi:hypothetical protein